MSEAIFVVKSSDGTLYGCWSALTEAVDWAEKNDDDLGDWLVEEVYKAWT